MLKKFIFILILIPFLTCGLAYKTDKELDTKLQNQYLMSLPNFRKITPEKTKAVRMMRYTEAGLDEKTTEDREEITKIYNFLNNIVLGKETKYSCTDNTTVYVFLLEDDTKIPVEIECNWIVIGRKQYLFHYSNCLLQRPRKTTWAKHE